MTNTLLLLAVSVAIAAAVNVAIVMAVTGVLDWRQRRLDAEFETAMAALRAGAER